jgi:hypothetical protein
VVFDTFDSQRKATNGLWALNAALALKANGTFNFCSIHYAPVGPAAGGRQPPRATRPGRAAAGAGAAG